MGCISNGARINNLARPRSRFTPDGLGLFGVGASAECDNERDEHARQCASEPRRVRVHAVTEEAMHWERPPEFGRHSPTPQRPDCTTATLTTRARFNSAYAPARS